MHELAIAQSLLEIVEQEALPYSGARVTRVKLLIGKLSGVVPDALRFAFEVISQGGIAEGASLDIQEVPLRLRCHQCGEVFVVDDPFMTCPRCEGPEVEMVSGRELEIRSMEIDDGDQAGQGHP
ncbi:MAG: hydrogenase maturation nickel metallochaperone HypA [Deltaproteobacteria bacterium]|nr:hydrogenase maturation nickel metallochaperone HypA [Deltaproteobacteria bacterium]